MKRFLAAVLIAPIRAYQRFISPAFAPRCRYYPTCSEYAVQSIRELGPVRGGDHAVAAAGEDPLDDLAKRVLVVDDQHRFPYRGVCVGRGFFER